LCVSALLAFVLACVSLSRALARPQTRGGKVRLRAAGRQQNAELEQTATPLLAVDWDFLYVGLNSRTVTEVGLEAWRHGGGGVKLCFVAAAVGGQRSGRIHDG
jgi:hypothetical protein